MTTLAREREAEVAKMEYLVLAQALLVGIDAKQFQQKMDVLNDLKMSMAEAVHGDIYIAGYHRQKKLKAMSEKRREREMLKKLQELGKKE